MRSISTKNIIGVLFALGTITGLAGHVLGWGFHKEVAWVSFLAIAAFFFIFGLLLQHREEHC